MKSFLLALCTLLLFTAASHAQVAVYRLSFKTVGQNVNYKAYQDGYYITPVGGGTGSLILLQKGTSGNVYYSFANFGQMFIAASSKGQKMVLTAVSSSTAADTSLFAIGDANQKLDFVTPLSTPATASTTGTTAASTQNVSQTVQLAGTLTGYEFTADSQSDMPFVGNATTQGVAGASTMTLSLQSEMTSLALSQNYSLAGEVTYIENLLSQQGYTSGNSTTSTTGTGTNTGTGTTTGN